MNKTDTPRTNEAAIGFARILIEKGTPENPKFECVEIIPSDFARTLERDLSAAQARIKELEEILRMYLATADKPMGMSELAEVDEIARAALKEKS
jgi:hypothetical protein